MIDAVFIADLHLSPVDSDILNRFQAFLKWAQTSVKSIYILGDFFHAWAGDDSMDEWSTRIANQLRALTQQGITIYYLHGNRDFLLGKIFARQADWTLLSEPSFIELGGKKVMIVHGDRYCTKDTAHQWFRRLTRNRLFTAIFLKLPLRFRQRLVQKVRDISLNKQYKPMDQMDVVAEDVIKHMLSCQTNILIHGHTHKPGLTRYIDNSQDLNRYVLSDWDDTPQVLCYDSTKGFYFIHLGECYA